MQGGGSLKDSAFPGGSLGTSCTQSWTPEGSIRYRPMRPLVGGNETLGNIGLSAPLNPTIYRVPEPLDGIGRAPEPLGAE